MSETDTEADERERIRQRKAEELQRRLGGDGTSETEVEEDGRTSTEPIHVTGPDHLDELVADGGVVLVDFYADWCGPCKMLEPIVERIAAETAATVAKVDVDSQQGLASQYRVQGVPTIYLFADGERVEQLVGARDEGTLRSLVERYT
ncbi:thioredoxin [Salinirubellus sp. GCM10025818]|jgi:thioredoxin 1|uniref:thioredoxin n=1 Tax=Salinirubellus TaxID=2162630 RepID=UPI0030CB088E